MLTEPEAKSVLAAYGIPVPETRVAATAMDAGDLASDLLRRGGRLAVKLLSRDISHKSDVGGRRPRRRDAEMKPRRPLWRSRSGCARRRPTRR